MAATKKKTKVRPNVGGAAMMLVLEAKLAELRGADFKKELSAALDEIQQRLNDDCIIRLKEQLNLC